MTVRDTIANLASVIVQAKGEVETWLREKRLGDPTDQARELVERLQAAVAGEPVALLATMRTLEDVAATAHRWTSEEGIPGQLRTLAKDLEDIRDHLRRSLGYDEWNLL